MRGTMKHRRMATETLRKVTPTSEMHFTAEANAIVQDCNLMVNAAVIQIPRGRGPWACFP